MDNVNYSCVATEIIDGKKIQCIISLSNMVVNFERKIKPSKINGSVKGEIKDLRDTRIQSGVEKFGLFKKPYIEIMNSTSVLRKFFFKNDKEHNEFKNVFEKEIEKKKNEVYSAACKLSESKNISDIENAIKEFNSIINWLDSSTKAKTCNEQICEIQYGTAKKHINKHTIKDNEIAISILKNILEWKDSNSLIAQCEEEIKQFKYNNAKILIDNNTSKSCEDAISTLNEIKDYEDSSEILDKCKKKLALLNNMDLIKQSNRSILELVLFNPYYILGMPCTASQSELLNVKDKIEKFARLKIKNAYKSPYDLSNIELPEREIGNIQSAIVATKDIKYKWLWFSTNIYCSKWEDESIFEELESSDSNTANNYDLMIACYLYLLIKDSSINDTDKWDTLIGHIDYLLGLSSIELAKYLKKHIGSDEKVETIGTLIDSFRKAILQPFINICISANKSQIERISNLIGFDNKKANEEIGSAIIMNLTNRCYQIENYLKDLSNSPTKQELDKLITITTEVENDVYTNINSMINIVGNTSTYAKRIKKKYKDVLWSVMIALNSNKRVNDSKGYAKKIYSFCEKDDQRRLRNEFGYETFGVSEHSLDPDELNSLAIKFEEAGKKSKAIQLFKKAADAGEPFAQSNLAFRYFQGDGVTKDISQAIFWWKKAANAGNAIAEYGLWEAYISEGPHQNVSEGARWLRKACEHGCEPAMGIFNKLVEMAKGYDYQQRNFALDLLRKMGLDV